MAEPEKPPTTVFNRVLNVAQPTLYHYCDTNAFLSIIENGTIRFSDANMMNDRSEGRYGYELFERAAGRILKDKVKYPQLEGITNDFFGKVDEFLSPKQLYSHPVIACFSKQPDVLSQWRAYGNDGKGWSIGFTLNALNAMPVTLLEVLYDLEQQLDEVTNHLVGMYFIWQKEGGDFDSAIGSEARRLASLLLAYKHPSFAEEQEVRALHELRVDIDETGAMLTDEGGVSDGDDVEGQQIRFRSANNFIVAYIDIPFSRPKITNPITELWLGPRNENGVGNALYPMTNYGFRNIKFKGSESHYRG